MPELAEWAEGRTMPGPAAGERLTGGVPRGGRLVLGAIRVGVLGLYRETPGSLSPGALADVLVCADTALLLLLNSRAGMDGGGDGLARWLVR